eukprot:Nk52_evm2s291 gene=Nk52_evmTU2s291
MIQQLQDPNQLQLHLAETLNSAVGTSTSGRGRGSSNGDSLEPSAAGQGFPITVSGAANARSPGSGGAGGRITRQQLVSGIVSVPSPVVIGSGGESSDGGAFSSPVVNVGEAEENSLASVTSIGSKGKGKEYYASRKSNASMGSQSSRSKSNASVGDKGMKGLLARDRNGSDLGEGESGGVSSSSTSALGDRHRANSGNLAAHGAGGKAAAKAGFHRQSSSPAGAACGGEEKGGFDSKVGKAVSEGIEGGFGRTFSAQPDLQTGGSHTTGKHQPHQRNAAGGNANNLTALEMEDLGQKRRNVGMSNFSAFLQLRRKSYEVLFEFQSKNGYFHVLWDITSQYWIFFLLISVTYSSFFVFLVLTFTEGEIESPSKRGQSLYPNYRGALVEAFCLIIILFSNSLFAVREEHLKRNEISNRVQFILDAFLGEESYANWSNGADTGESSESEVADKEKLWRIAQQYLDPFSPRSDSIMLSLVYRDGKLMNIPNNLLVEGDVILLSPGRPAPCRVLSVDPKIKPAISLQEAQIFLKDKAFVPKTEHISTDVRQAVMFEVKSTPLLSHLKYALHSDALRPTSKPRQELEKIVGKGISQYLVIIVFLLSMLVNGIRFAASTNSNGTWLQTIFRMPIYAALPLLPLIFPVMWVGLNTYGSAKLLAMSHYIKGMSNKNSGDGWVESDDSDDDEYEDIDEKTAARAVGAVTHMQIFHLFIKNMLGHGDNCLSRSSNLLQTLGHITTVCCLDRDGVLNVPLSFPEKVIFASGENDEKRGGVEMFSTSKPKSEQRELEEPALTSEEAVPVSTGKVVSFNVPYSSGDDTQLASSRGGTPLKQQSFSNSRSYIPVVLDMAYDPSSRFGLRFEDTEWSEFMAALKPLGLGCIMNSVPTIPAELMRAFEDHLVSVTMKMKGIKVPAFNSALYKLAMASGFQENAIKKFKRRKLIGCFAPYHPSVLPCKANSFMDTSSFLSFVDYKAFGSNLVNVMSIPHMMVQLFEDTETGGFQVITQGSVELVLDHCRDYWDGNTLRPLKLADRKKILDKFYSLSHTLDVVAFAYKPVSNRYAAISGGKKAVFFDMPAITHENDFYNMTRASDILETKGVESIAERVIAYRLACGQVFLGFTALQRPVKLDVRDIVEDLNCAGMRFVYFSAEDELRSRAFGHKLGLETGWNCRISLDSNAEVEQAAGKLPKGIENIRPHLRDVDDVPLLVPLFTDCHPDATRQMIEIMQENGEVVCCIGSSLNHHNLASYCLSDLSIALAPVHPREETNFMGSLPVPATPSFGSGWRSELDRFKSAQSQQSWAAEGEEGGLFEKKTLKHSKFTWTLFSGRLNAVPCSLHLHRDTSLNILLVLVREARRLSVNGKQCFSYILACNASLSLSLLLSHILLLPPMFDGIQILFLTLFIVPFLSLPMLIVGTDPNIMKILPNKNIGHLKDVRRFIIYFFLRFFFFIIGCPLIFSLCLKSYCDSIDLECHTLISNKSFDLSPNTYSGWTSLYSHALFFSQNITLFCCILFYAALALTFLYRTKPLQQYKLKRELFYFVLFASLSLALGAVFFYLYMHLVEIPYDNIKMGFSDLYWFVYVVIVVLLAFLIALNELVKNRDQRFFIRSQKMLKLIFDTKLGMHSPV